MMRISLPVLIAFTALAFADDADEPEAKPVKKSTIESQFTVAPIGFVQKQGKRTSIQLDPRYREGLLGLDKWSHIWVFWWFDQNDTPTRRAKLQVHPRGNQENPLTGVFATRSPVRPNLVALSLCQLISVEGDRLEIETIDAFDQTPVIDIKPYIKSIDAPKTATKKPDWAGPQ